MCPTVLEIDKDTDDNNEDDEKAQAQINSGHLPLANCRLLKYLSFFLEKNNVSIKCGQFRTVTEVLKAAQSSMSGDAPVTVTCY